jgi:hypothetical protein
MSQVIYNKHHANHVLTTFLLDVEGGKIENNTKLINYPKHGGCNQQFVITDRGCGNVSIDVAGTDLCVDILDGEMSHYRQVIVYKYHGGLHQLWKVKANAAGDYVFHSAKDETYVLNLHKADGRMIIFPYHGEANQVFSCTLPFAKVGCYTAAVAQGTPYGDVPGYIVNDQGPCYYTMGGATVKSDKYTKVRGIAQNANDSEPTSQHLVNDLQNNNQKTWSVVIKKPCGSLVIGKAQKYDGHDLVWYAEGEKEVGVDMNNEENKKKYTRSYIAGPPLGS